MQTKTVILFARLPRFGVVKTRLQKDIGAVETLRFYKNTLNSVMSQLEKDPRIDLKIAVTPDFAVENAASPLFNDYSLMRQGRGDLGARMARALTHGNGPTVIIGSDIPDITPNLVLKAFRALATADIVFSPAEDGGYSLIGRKRSNQPPGFLKGVRWSSAHTLTDTLATLPKTWKIKYIEPVADIDDGETYIKWKQMRKLRRIHRNKRDV